MPLKLHDKHSYDFIVDIIDDAIMGTDMAGIRNTISTLQRLRMPSTCPRMVNQLMKNFAKLLIP